MDILIELLKEINIAQLTAIGAVIWFFYTRLDNKIEKSHQELKYDIAKLSDKVEDIDRRLCRIEGSLASHGHCLFNQSSHDKKAQ